MAQTADIEQRDKAKKKEAFITWMEQPATRMMMSMIPAAENAEVLQTLLQETFNSGFATGAGQTAIGFLEAMMTNMGKPKDK